MQIRWVEHDFRHSQPRGGLTKLRGNEVSCGCQVGKETEGIADKALLDHTPKLGRKRRPATRRAMEIAAAFKSGRPKATLAEVAAISAAEGTAAERAAVGTVER